jgi:hypothetical protein
VQLSIRWHVHPAGWCSHGRQESNLQQLVLETSALPG